MSSPSSKLPNLTTDTEEFITKIESENETPLYKLTPEKARELLHDLQVKTKKYVKEIDADIEDTDIMTVEAGTVNIRIVRPKGSTEKLPVILYVHGGGWIMGDKEVFDHMIKKLAVCTNSAVFFVNYSKSPDAIYPLALTQIYGVLDYVYSNPDQFNVDSDKIVIAGDSAGANMATVTALQAKKQNGPNILFEALFYPVTSAEMDTDSYHSFKDGPWLTKKAMEWFWDAYVPDKKLREDGLVSPLNALYEDLKEMPPTLIITAENDVLRDEGEAYARKLDSAGVKVLNVRINGTIHDFMMLNALSETMPVKGAFKIACTMIKHAFAKY